MGVIQVPCIANDVPSDLEHLDWEDYRTPHYIVLYTVVDWCIAQYTSLNYTNIISSEVIDRLSVNLEEQQQATNVDELFDLRAEERRIRHGILQDYIAYICDPSTESDFDRTMALSPASISAILYSIAYALPDQFGDPRDLMLIHSYDYVEGYLKTYNKFSSPTYDFYEFTEALTRTAREYFRRFQLGLREGKIRLDPRYRHHFRISLLDAFETIRVELGDSYWTKEFPPRDEEDRLPDTRCYELDDRVYDWQCEYDLPEDNRIIFRQPYAPLLEAHHIAKLKVLLNVLEGFQRYLEGAGLYSDQIIAILICFEDHAFRLWWEMDISEDAMMQYRVAAHADRTAICMHACKFNSDDHEDSEDTPEEDMSNLSKEEVFDRLFRQLLSKVTITFMPPKQNDICDARHLTNP